MQRKMLKVSILKFQDVKPIYKLFHGTGLHSWGPSASFDTHIGISSVEKCRMPNASSCQTCQNAIFAAHAIWLMSYIDMAIWLSKDASGPQECRPMPLNNLCIGLTSWNFKKLTFKIFLYIFYIFLCIFKNSFQNSEQCPKTLKTWISPLNMKRNGILD